MLRNQEIKEKIRTGGKKEKRKTGEKEEKIPERGELGRKIGIFRLGEFCKKKSKNVIEF